MSKKVKAVKCPQCKSTKNIFLGEDKYKCEHCDAEFILDNDDVNVYINHHRRPQHQADNEPTNYKTPIIGFLMGLLTIVVVLVIVFSTKSAGHSAATVTSAPKADNLTIIEGSGIIISNATSSKPIYVVLAKQMDKRKTEILSYEMLVYDILQDKQIKRTELEATTKIGIRMFPEEDIYLISGMKTLYKLHPETFELSNISDEFRTDYSQFSSGISSIDFSPEKGGLVVITNEGKTYTVFPEQKQIFTLAELAQFKSSKAVSPVPDEQLVVKTTDGAILLYTDGRTDLLHYKNASGNDFIIEYRDINTKETKWKVNVPSKIEQVKPYKDGFALIDNMNKLLVVKKDGKSEEIEL